MVPLYATCACDLGTGDSLIPALSPIQRLRLGPDDGITDLAPRRKSKLGLSPRFLSRHVYTFCSRADWLSASGREQPLAGHRLIGF
jgi:hypothetical protein